MSAEPVATAAVRPPSAPAPVSGDAAWAPIEAALRRLSATATSRPRFVSATVPVRRVDPIQAFAAALRTGKDAILWMQPSAGRALVGIGSAMAVRVEGPDRFARAADAWRELLGHAAIGGPAAGTPGSGPLLFGGATFADRRSRDAIWQGFETGRFDLASLLVGASGDGCILTANLRLEPDQRLEPPLGALRRAVGELFTPPPSDPGPSGAAVLRVTDRRPGRDAWRSSVVRSSGAVGRGRLDKVVLARRVDLRADGPIDLPGVLRRLEASAPGSTVFAFARSGRTFLGTTPERLVETRGRAFRTIALAGTIGRGNDEADDRRLAAELLASEKDREEHAVVVAMLRETLGPVVERLDVDRTPCVLRLPTVQHLATEVSGRVRGGVGILELVARLHPTPAVGGWPRDLALELIEEQEHLDRGWYAGPVGWLDAEGDGEFVVAIRSGVVEADRVSLFAGCGIVADSEPDREWDESELKLRALGGALGTVEP